MPRRPAALGYPIEVTANTLFNIVRVERAISEEPACVGVLRGRYSRMGDNAHEMLPHPLTRLRPGRLRLCFGCQYGRLHPGTRRRSASRLVQGGFFPGLYPGQRV